MHRYHTALRHAAALFLALLLVCSAVPVFASAERRTDAASGFAWVIDDEAGYFNESELRELGSLLSRITPYCNAVLATTESHPYSSTFDYAEHCFDDLFDRDADGIVFVIDRDLNEIFLYTNGSIRRTITDSRAYSITDNTYIYATAAHDYDYGRCSAKTLEQVQALLEGRKIAEPMKYICSALLAVIVALLANYFIAMFLSRSRRANIREILTGTYNDVRVNDPKAVFVNQTKRYSPRSSGSSGGGRSGGGGGGRSHGGGGGHRI